MSDKIAEIRARHAGYSLNSGNAGWANDDRGWLLAEVERQARHVEELREKIDAERSCACSFDGPGDICAAHSPALMNALAEVERLREALRWYADLTNYMPPVIVVFEEPPALLDKGTLARNALEGKP